MRRGEKGLNYGRGKGIRLGEGERGYVRGGGKVLIGGIITHSIFRVMTIGVVTFGIVTFGIVTFGIVTFGIVMFGIVMYEIYL